MNVQKELFNSIERIAIALEGILSLVKSGGAEKEPPKEVSVNDSMGSCPDCDSHEVSQRGRYPAAIYQCSKCEYLWVNEPNAFFNND